jgi:hypothetical protein
MSFCASRAHIGKFRDAVSEFSAMQPPKFPGLILLEPKSPLHEIRLEKTSALARGLLAFSEIDFATYGGWS